MLFIIYNQVKYLNNFTLLVTFPLIINYNMYIHISFMINKLIMICL